jgi:hypothetical protein
MRLKAPIGGCTIRLYRHGLGDCFLLAFAGANRQQKYMLIDCGVLLGTSDADTTMQAVAEDIKAATGGHLHVLVITHEHWDHISGFQQAQAVFDDIRVDKVWFAWTEDPDDAFAGELRQRRRQALQALQQVALRLTAAESAQAGQIGYLLNFFGETLAASGRATTENILEDIKTRWPEHQYCTPGMAPLTLSGLPAVRFFVLGPPRDKKYIRKSRPSSRDSEVYLSGAVRQQALALTELADGPAEDGWQPFHPAYRVAYDDPDIAEIRQRYNDEQLIWRQIGHHWQAAAGELALDLDSHTNNTSLVLAIELSPGGKVLLFPGDAQVGNWLSWHEVKWPQDNAGLTAAELLHRTVFYTRAARQQQHRSDRQRDPADVIRKGRHDDHNV